MSTKMTVSELIGSMTGYEEDAVAAAFGSELEELDEIALVRALVFVQERRELGVEKAGAAPLALDAAKSISRKALMEFFVSAEVEPFPDEPVTLAGND